MVSVNAIVGRATEHRRTSRVLAERASASTAMRSVRRCAAMQGHRDARDELGGRRYEVATSAMVLGEPLWARSSRPKRIPAARGRLA